MSAYTNTGANGKKAKPPIFWVLIACIALLLVLLGYQLGKPEDDNVVDRAPSPAETEENTPEPTPNHIHVWAQPSCTEDGYCKICGIAGDPAHGHTWAEASCTAPKTCTVCGAKEGSALGHSWKDATCTEAKTCKVCGTQEGSALGHSWKAATCTEPKTCKVCGSTTGSALGHSWKAATCTEPKTCKVCGSTTGSALGHSWVAATYEQPRHCTVCGLQDGTTVARPSAKDLDSIGSNIVYPNEYLSEYKTRTVVAKHKICVYIYYSAKATEDNRLPYDLAHMTKVTVIAEKNGLSCVIYKDANGNNRSGWVTSTHLVE